MMRRLLVSMTLTVTALSCASGGDMANRARTGEPPPYAGGVSDTLPVGAIPDVVLHDNDRNKDIRVSVEYPARAGVANPLIVFSPELGRTNRDYVGLSSYWASRGYVVIRTSHADSGGESTQTPADWRNRVRDVTFAIDSVPQLIQRFPELEGKIDARRVGVAGHGYGAFTALLLAGVRTFPGGVSYADPRVKAAVTLSPPGPSAARGLTEESWSGLTGPVLFVTGTADRGMDDSETPDWRKQAFTLSPAGEKWLVVLDGARHATFTGRFDNMLDAAARQRAQPDLTDPNPPNDPNNPNPSPLPATRSSSNQRMSRAEYAAFRQQDLFNLTRGLAYAFWDTYLRDKPEGRKALEEATGKMNVVVEKK